MGNNRREDTASDLMDITVKIDGSPLTLRIHRDDERHLRMAATDFNRVYALYRDRYSGNATSVHELLQYTALHFAAQVAEMRIAHSEEALLKRLQAIDDRLEQALYPTTAPSDDETIVKDTPQL